MNWCLGAYTSEKISNIPSFHGFAGHLLRSLDVLNLRVGHTMDILSPFISVLCHFDCLPSVLWRCWLDSRNGIWPLKKLEWWGAGMVICLERGADLHVAQLMPLPLTVSCFSKIQVGFTFLVPAHSGSPGQRAVKWACVCVCVCHSDWLFHGKSCPHIDIVHPDQVWSSSPACTWHYSLHYLFLQATPLFPHGVTIACYLPCFDGV